MKVPPKQNRNVIMASNPKMPCRVLVSILVRSCVISSPYFRIISGQIRSSRFLVSFTVVLQTVIKLAFDSVARISDSSSFQYFLQPVEIRRHLFGRELSYQGKRCTSYSSQRNSHYFANVRLIG